ncbi:hypothetical protein, partial [Streptomyces sp. NPDC001508]|uniref:hypothetical protein n=1 Tax=Streptomyces sp. NPDC001508 TaxID=3154656 RepID=UPI00332CA737
MKHRATARSSTEPRRAPDRAALQARAAATAAVRARAAPHIQDTPGGMHGGPVIGGPVTAADVSRRDQHTGTALGGTGTRAHRSRPADDGRG